MKRQNRILKAQEFQKLIHTGEKLANQSFVLYHAEKKREEARFGITLPKKIGKAVDRNLYKRQVRMICQELIDFSSCQKDVILVIRFAYKYNSYEQNKKNLEKLLLKAKIK